MAATSKQYAVGLGFLALVFSLRVLGQALVAFWGVKFLPPMDAWYSGLIPYGVLLPIQLVILVFQAKISVDTWRGCGLFSVRRPNVGKLLCWISFFYFAVMLLRYVVTMALYPERRWLGGTIPIFFHWVLAAYLYLLGRFQNEPGEASIAHAGNRMEGGP
jgi:hypothetical protein